MARLIRIEYPDADYHIINRKNRQDQLLFPDSAYIIFLDKMPSIFS